MGLTAHLARRGIMHAVAKRDMWINGERVPDIEVPAWGTAVLSLTAVVFVLFMFSVSSARCHLQQPFGLPEIYAMMEVRDKGANKMCPYSSNTRSSKSSQPSA
jgi:hypothetical protein